MASEMRNRNIVLGTTLRFGVTFLDSAGNALSMTSKTATLRMMKNTDPRIVYVRSTATATHFTWTTQSAGTGTWLFEKDVVMEEGDYTVEVWIDDTVDTPDAAYIVGTARYSVRLPATITP